MQDLEEMLNSLYDASQRVGLRMNLDSTKSNSKVKVIPELMFVGVSALEVLQE